MIPTNESETSKVTGEQRLAKRTHDPNVFDRYAPLNGTSEETK